jgi:hypothetical protein
MRVTGTRIRVGRKNTVYVNDGAHTDMYINMLVARNVATGNDISLYMCGSYVTYLSRINQKELKNTHIYVASVLTSQYMKKC